ncbi:MAG: flagellar motor switch protein FliG [Pseudomonadota bacterium]
MAEAGQLTGVDQAAVLLLSLGEQEAGKVLKLLEPPMVERLGTAIAALNSVSREQVSDVLETFATDVEDETSFGVGSEDYIRAVLINAFGEDRAITLLDRIFADRSSQALESLAWMETADIAEMISNEHPQIIAIVLSYLEGERAGEVVAELPDELVTDVLMRIARLDDVQQSALLELEKIMNRQSPRAGSSKSETVNGEKVAAGILNAFPSDREESIVKAIESMDGDLSKRIQELMLVFENLLEVDDRGIQALMREIPGDSLGLALRGTDPELKAKIFRNMSKRAAQMLEEDMEAKGPVRVAEVEEAQKAIMEIARRLADDGTIVFSGGGNDFV